MPTTSHTRRARPMWAKTLFFQAGSGRAGGPSGPSFICPHGVIARAMPGVGSRGFLSRP